MRLPCARPSQADESRLSGSRAPRPCTSSIVRLNGIARETALADLVRSRFPSLASRAEPTGASLFLRSTLAGRAGTSPPPPQLALPCLGSFRARRAPAPPLASCFLASRTPRRNLADRRDEQRRRSPQAHHAALRRLSARHLPARRRKGRAARVQHRPGRARGASPLPPSSSSPARTAG